MRVNLKARVHNQKITKKQIRNKNENRQVKLRNKCFHKRNESKPPQMLYNIVNKKHTGKKSEIHI